MRTTIRLDPDLASRLRELASERRISFTSVVNAILRAGLEVGERQARPYQEVTHDLGIRPGVDLTKALQLAAALEDEATAGELELRK